jgi:hypothetical protein
MSRAASFPNHIFFTATLGSFQSGVLFGFLPRRGEDAPKPAPPNAF